MYGMVNKAIEDLVVSSFGLAQWEAIKERAGVDVDVFISDEGYPDDITYRLVAAAEEILKMPADKILIAFGEHWVLKTASEGYGSLMQAGGNSLPEFLRNLPSFHTRIEMILPNLKPPRFSCSDLTPTSLHLHYFTERPGLTMFVVGLMRGLATMFNTTVEIVVLKSRAEGHDHDVLLVTWPLAGPAA